MHEEDKQYAYLTMIYWSGIVNVSRVRLGEGHNFNWHTRLISRSENILTVETDQTLYYKSSPESDLRKYKEIHFNGCVIYKDWKFWRRWL